MHKKPKSVEELQKIGDYEAHCLALLEHLMLNWEGLNDVKPNGYDAFIKDYDDFQGMEEWDENIRPQQEAVFNGFNNAAAGGFNFVGTTSLPHIAYDDLCQARSPVQMLIGACVSYGWACGEVYGIEEGKKIAAQRLVTLATDLL